LWGRVTAVLAEDYNIAPTQNVEAHPPARGESREHKWARCFAGIALVVAIYSALKRLPVQAGLVILGDLSIQGNIKPLRSLAEPLQVAMDILRSKSGDCCVFCSYG
jgi:hypothetical protein